MVKKRQPSGPYSDTMTAAAGALGVPIQLIQAAKDSGCPAFRHSRVYHEPLKVWIAENADRIAKANEEAALERRRKVAEAEWREERVLKSRQQSIRLTEVNRWWYRNVTAAKMKLKIAEAALSAEVAMRLNLTPEQAGMIREIHARLNRQAMLELFEGNWGKVACPECKKEIE